MTAIYATGATRSVPARRSGLGALVVLCIMAAPVLRLLWPADLSLEIRGAATLLWVCCLYPLYAYMRRPPTMRPPIPFIPLVGMLYAFYYAMPLLIGTRRPDVDFVRIDPGQSQGTAVELALIGWLMLVVGYAVAGGVVRQARGVPARDWDVRVVRIWALGMLWGGIICDIFKKVATVPVIVAGVVTFIANLALFGACLLVVLGLHQGLTRGQRRGAIAGIALLLALQVGTGLVSNLAFVALPLAIAAIASGRRLSRWWYVGALAAALFAVSLRAVIIDFRRQAWFGGEELSLVERNALQLRILARKVATVGVVQTVSEGMQASADRSALADVFAAVIERTPRDIPYWGGETYLSLVGAAVPRFIWPDKPMKTLGQDFGHRYDFLDPFDLSTSVNFPFLVEFYANFGALGVCVGMLLVGFIYRALERTLNNPRQDVVTTICGLTILTPLLNLESDLSLVFGGLLLNGAALFLVVRMIRIASRQARARARESERQTSAHRYAGSDHPRFAD